MAQTEFKPFRAQARMKELIAAYFHSVDAASKNPEERVAWCTSGGPAELLLSFGFRVYYPENHAALIGASRKANDFMPLAHSQGYSQDICSYLTSDIGAHLKGDTPLKRLYGIEEMPRPDILVFNTNQCRDVQDWFDYYSREFKAPMTGISSPLKVGANTKELVEGLILQYKAMIPILEKISGVKFDIDRFREIVDLSGQTTVRWRNVLKSGRARPSPLTFFDANILMAPAVVLRGTQEAIDFYDLVQAEIEERNKSGAGAVGDEKYRLYWEGMPIWGKLRSLAGLFFELKSPVVASTYCNAWVYDAFASPGDPFERLARAYLEVFITRTDDIKEAVMGKLLAEYQVDGIVYHDAKTCPNNSNTRYGLPKRLKEKTGLPYVVVYGDLNDLRCYSEEQTRTNLEALIEQLDSIKR